MLPYFSMNASLCVSCLYLQSRLNMSFRLYSFP